MAEVFVSYRQGDESANKYARLIADRLMSHFGSSSVFLDVYLEPGTNFVEAIIESVRSSHALLAIIGEGWLAEIRRLSEPRDYVALELRTALQRGITVIPVLVDGSKMPLETDLPDDLRDLARKCAVETNHKHFDADIAKLIGQLDSQAGTNTPPARDYFFGYFCVEEGGYETVLVGIDDQRRLRFPIADFAIYGETIEQEIDRAVTRFIPKVENLNLTVLSPVVTDLSAGDSFLPYLDVDDVPTKIRPFFFKVPVTGKGKLNRTDLTWIAKSKFLPAKTPNRPSESRFEHLTPGARTLAKLVTRDRIQHYLGKRTLECVDILVFRQKENPDSPGDTEGNDDLDAYEFLLLNRQTPTDSYKGWEYPKGGIEYHETVQEGAIRELLEETGLGATGGFRYGGYLGCQIADVRWRNASLPPSLQKPYDYLQVHGVTYLFYGRDNDIDLKHTGGDAERFTDFRWMSWEEAKDTIAIGQYAKRFFDLWKAKRWKTLRHIARPISLAFQVSEECPLGCRFCLRRQEGENDTSIEQWKEIVDILAERGILRLAVTGGEPLVTEGKKRRVFELLEYAHAQRIHTCLSTTGWRLTETDMERLDGCLDQLLLSSHSVDQSLAPKLYENEKTWGPLHRNLENILQWTRDKTIIVEISTVVCKINAGHMVSLGQWLYTRHPTLFWRLDEYYANGAQGMTRFEFELTKEEYDRVEETIRTEFPTQFADKRLRFSRKESRLVAPDIMIAPRGTIVTSAANEYALKGFKQDLLFVDLKNRRKWSEYLDCIRTDWNW